MQFDPHKDCPLPEDVIERETIFNSTQKLNECLLARGLKAIMDPQETYERSYLEYEKKQFNICSIASAWKLPEDLNDFWFSWRSWDSSWTEGLRMGAKAVADTFIKLLREDILELAGYKFDLQEYKGKLSLEKDLTLRVKKSYQDVIDSCEKGLAGGPRLVRTRKIFTDPEALKEAIICCGASQMSLLYGNTITPEEYVLERLEWFKKQNTIATIGKESTLAALEEETGIKITEENYKDLYYDHGTVYARIQGGEEIFIGVL